MTWALANDMWLATDTSDPRALKLADQHYTRQTVGSKQFMRPGYRLVLVASDAKGLAVFGWWRPKWEDGSPFLQRKDGLRAIECVIFRNSTAMLSSELIRSATAVVQSWEHANDVDWPDGLITGVGSEQTTAGRSKWHKPGWCFRKAGWEEFDHKPGRADVWLRCSALPPAAPLVWERRGQLSIFDATARGREGG